MHLVLTSRSLLPLGPCSAESARKRPSPWCVETRWTNAGRECECKCVFPFALDDDCMSTLIHIVGISRTLSLRVTTQGTLNFHICFCHCWIYSNCGLFALERLRHFGFASTYYADLHWNACCTKRNLQFKPCFQKPIAKCHHCATITSSSFTNCGFF